MDKNQANTTPEPTKSTAPKTPALSPGAARAVARQQARAAAKAAAAAAPKVERITAEDLKPYQHQLMMAELMKRSSETVTARAGEAAQAANAGKLTLFVKYKLSTTDTFDVKSGVITRGGAAAGATPAAAPAPTTPASS